MTAIFTGFGAGLERSSANILGSSGQIGSSALGRAGESVSVNAATGNLVISRRDEFLTGRGLDIGISRTYNSRADVHDGDNGDQWQQNTTRRVFGLVGKLNSAKSKISRLGADGSSITYTWSTKIGAYITTDGAGAYDTLRKVGKRWIWTDGTTQIKETYTAYGKNNWRIVQQQDSDGNAITFSYSGSKLNKITSANGEYTQYHWSGKKITRITTYAGSKLTRTYYSYDSRGRLSSVATDLSEKDNTLGKDKYVVSYTYHGASNRIASISQTDGSKLSITYDKAGRVTTLRQVVAGGDSRVTRLVYGKNVTTVKHADGTSSKLHYDNKKQLTQISFTAAEAGSPVTSVKFAYDGDGNVTQVTDQNGKTTKYQYDASRVQGAGSRGLATRIIDANNNQIDRWYDDNNNMTMESVVGSSGTAGREAQYTRFVYDDENHLRFRIGAAGDVTEFRYHAAGMLQSEIKYPEHRFPHGKTQKSVKQMEGWVSKLDDRQSAQLVRYFYDARGNLTQKIAYGSATSKGGASTKEGYSHQYFTYDRSGQLLRRRNAALGTEHFVYDGMGRIVVSTDLDGGKTRIVFKDAATRTVVTTASGAVTTSVYNKAGELISQTNTGNHDLTGTSSYKYDKMGRLRQETDETGFNTYYVYDKQGRKVADINHAGHLTEYRYDKIGRVVANVSYIGAVSNKNLTKLSDPDHALEMDDIRPPDHIYDVRSWRVYDAAGRIIQEIDGAGGVERLIYDKAGRLIQTVSYFNKLTSTQLKRFRESPPNKLVLPATNRKDMVVRIFYDRAGRVIGRLDGEGYLSETVYDAAGQKIRETFFAQKTDAKLRASGTFNKLRASAGAKNAENRTTNFVYDGQGQLRFIVASNGLVTENIYWLSSAKNAVGLVRKTIVYAKPIITDDYSYRGLKAKVAKAGRSAQNRTTSYTYNAAGKVATATDAAGTRRRGQIG